MQAQAAHSGTEEPKQEVIEPRLSTIPKCWFHRFSFISTEPPAGWEAVYVPVGKWEGIAMDPATAAIFDHNLHWEAAPFVLCSNKKPVHPVLDRIQKRFPENVALRFIPQVRGDDGATAYAAYSSLFHLLPHQVRQRHGIPAKPVGSWPTEMIPETGLPSDLRVRLGNAFAAYIWPFLCRQSPKSAFSSHEPLTVLAHNLDFWMPHIDAVIREIVGGFEREGFDEQTSPADLARCRQSLPAGLTAERPLFGRTIWSGEEEARIVTEEMIERADSHGRLRGIIDAIRSHRVEDDFSPKWSRAKEDFERKLFSKRSKVKVTFVELSDTLPVHGPETEVEENVLWQDFFSLLSPTERRVVVCLRSGTTKGVDIAEELGYANHSPVSKALARIRKKAMAYLQ